MAGTSLLALIDDITTVLDDVAAMTKIAAKKTAAVVGDDLAVNAEQVAGVRADRELPVVWAVAKGSARNKLILVPAAILISSVAPWAIGPLLMLGGTYLCLEGVEKLVHALFDGRHKGAHREAAHPSPSEGSADIATIERQKIRGAIRTDFVLSAEIVVISMGTVNEASFVTRVTVIAGLAALMTVGVYGLVAAIVKLDDLGLYLAGSNTTQARTPFSRSLGRGILRAAPHLMRALSVVGTVAMFMVGGGILVHGLPFAQEAVHQIEERVHVIPNIGQALASITSAAVGTTVGVLAGGVVLVAIKAIAWVLRRIRNVGKAS